MFGGSRHVLENRQRGNVMELAAFIIHSFSWKAVKENLFQ